MSGPAATTLVAMPMPNPPAGLRVSASSHAILFDEMARVGAKTSAVSEDLLTLDRPDIDWVRIASGFGVEAERAASMEAFNAAFQRSIETHGPRLIELVI